MTFQTYIFMIFTCQSVTRTVVFIKLDYSYDNYCDIFNTKQSVDQLTQ